MDLNAAPDRLKQRDRELAAQMLLEVGQARHDPATALPIPQLQRIVPERESQAREQLQDAYVLALPQ